jgi:hypothetical protein
MSRKKIAEYENGVIIEQVTDCEALKDNIYCESSYCPEDSRGFVYQKKIRDLPFENKYEVEFILYNFSEDSEQVIGTGLNYGCVSPAGNFIFIRMSGDLFEVVRVDLNTLNSEVIAAHKDICPLTGMTINKSEELLVYGDLISYSPQMFSVIKFDLTTCKKETILIDPFLCNPHPQFEPEFCKEVLIQNNRGCLFEEDGKVVKSCGPYGANLFTININDYRITPLKTGQPYSNSITGHEQWIYGQQKVLFSAAQDENNTCKLLIGSTGNPVAAAKLPIEANHVHVSRCGNYFCCDTHADTNEVYIGSLKTGKAKKIFNFTPYREFRKKYGQSGDPHPYLTPNLRKCIFNSVHTGQPEICVASIPEEIIDELIS